MPATVAPNQNATIDPVAAQAMLAEGSAVLVDVREADEHRHERIVGAVSLPLSNFQPEDLRRFGGKHVILHCKSGARSADALRMAGAAGIEARSLAGGIEAWKSAGQPVVKEKGSHGISVMRQTQIVIGAGVLAGTLAGAFIHPACLVLPGIFGTGLIVAGSTGTCGLAVALSWMPWNRSKESATSCSTGKCS